MLSFGESPGPPLSLTIRALVATRADAIATQHTAEANVSAIGYHTLWCNGQRVSAHVMEPGRTSAKHVFFSRFDLAPHLRKGANVLAASLGNGWEASDGSQPGSTQQPPAFYLDTTITLAELNDGGGSVVRVVSNTSWSSGVGSSPTTGEKT